MQKSVYTVISFLFIFFSLPCFAEESKDTKGKIQQIQPISFTPFTGKILKEKVRLRLQPSLDAPIFQEMTKSDLLIVTGEYEEFYAVKPPPFTKAYVFRTFILDGIVEGSHVNVRLHPETDAPVLAQLNSGDPIKGQICQANQKWLEIEAPASVRFYVYKDYIDNIGDEAVFTKLEKRKEEVNYLLETAYRMEEEELKKAFEEINIQSAQDRLQKIVKNYKDFPEHVKEAENELHKLQEKYLEKKVTFLEDQSNSTKTLATKNKQLSKEMVAKQERILQLEKEIKKNQNSSNEQEKAELASLEQEVSLAPTLPNHTQIVKTRMSKWIPVEDSIFHDWSHEKGDSKEMYLLEQQETSITLNGILEAFDRPLKNKPGDFVLIDPQTKLPLGYLYSTKVDLESFLGQKITVEANKRPNHHFAFPAYHVLALD